MADGSAAVVERRGAEEAGAIFILVDRLNGFVDLYGPAPQSAFEDENPSDRRFQKLVENATHVSITSRLEREMRFDPDVWIVALESRAGTVDLDLV